MTPWRWCHNSLRALIEAGDDVLGASGGISRSFSFASQPLIHNFHTVPVPLLVKCILISSFFFPLFAAPARSNVRKQRGGDPRHRAPQIPGYPHGKELGDMRGLDCAVVIS